MTIRNRQRWLAIVTIALIGLCTAYQLVLSPLLAGWNQRAANLRELKQSVARGNLLLERQQTIRARWERMRAQSLPIQPSAAEDLLLKSFDRWAKAGGASFGSIRPQLKAAEPEFTLLECRADASGSLANLARFLYELEHDPLALKVESLEMTANDNNGQLITLTLQVSGLILTPQGTP
jgi:Tfp pilus assembly protein PilO